MRMVRSQIVAALTALCLFAALSVRAGDADVHIDLPRYLCCGCESKGTVWIKGHARHRGTVTIYKASGEGVVAFSLTADGARTESISFPAAEAATEDGRVIFIFPLDPGRMSIQAHWDADPLASPAQIVTQSGPDEELPMTGENRDPEPAEYTPLPTDGAAFDPRDS